jgi:hypothetical protein
MGEKENGELTKVSLEFENFINYEAIVCSFFPNSQKVNASCMGINFTPTGDIFMRVFEKTDTLTNLTSNSLFSINFSDNFYDYAIAALHGWNKGENEPEFPEDAYISINPAPILKNAWATVICQVLPLDLMVLPNCRGYQQCNIRAKILQKTLYHLPKIFNNRSMNLAFEALIISTRIPIYEPFSKEFNQNLEEYKKIKRKLLEWRDMDRFELSFQLMDNYLLKNSVKSLDLFEM